MLNLLKLCSIFIDDGFHLNIQRRVAQASAFHRHDFLKRPRVKSNTVFCSASKSGTYRIRANKGGPLSIRPPLWQNSDKTTLFFCKSPIFGAFWGKNWENSNIPPLKNSQILVERRPFKSVDMVLTLNLNVPSLPILKKCVENQLLL